VFLNHAWFLASASFLVECLCRSNVDDVSLQHKLNYILRVLRHVGVKLDLCAAEDMLPSTESVGFLDKAFIEYRPTFKYSLVRARGLLTKQLNDFLSSTDKDNMFRVGKATVYGLWDIYTIRETSKEVGYEDWEIELRDDAVKNLLKIAFRR